MRKIIVFIVLVVCFFITSNAQEKSKEPPQKFMQITTIESVVGGGLGRSKMIITKEDGSQDKRDMENLFSLTGMNIKNIKSNESDIIKTLKSFTDDGWKITQVIPLH